MKKSLCFARNIPTLLINVGLYQCVNFFITGTFDIILCVDVIETTGGQAKSRKEALIPELKKNGMRWFVIGGSG